MKKVLKLFLISVLIFCQHSAFGQPQFHPAAPVVADGDTLFIITSRKGGQTPAQRAENVSGVIEELGKRINFKAELVTILHEDIMSDIMYEDEIIVSVTDADARAMETDRETLASERKEIIVAQLNKIHSRFSIWAVIKRILYFILVIAAQYGLIRLTNWGYKVLKEKIAGLKDTKLHPISFQNYEILNTDKQVALLNFASNLLRYALIAIQLVVTVPIIFSIFPSTKGLAMVLLGYIWAPIEKILTGIINYIPNLISIIIIWYAVRSLVKLTHYVAKEVESGKLKLGNFFPEWAMPTYNIIRILLYAFMVAMIYNYLPGSDTGVFQGISVFIGLIISLGSSTMIANLMAGLVITFMRPFKVGDRIKLNDTTGDIIEKTPLVTRVKTPKNEIVTIPNSFVMSSMTVNYSSSANEYGLIIHTDVTFGYEVPWQQVHELMIEAALATPLIVKDQKPFVLQTRLDDWYVVYQINAYTRNPECMAKIYSDLHQNILDKFHAAGIEVMSPHFMGVRTSESPFIPETQKKSFYANADCLK